MIELSSSPDLPADLDAENDRCPSLPSDALSLPPSADEECSGELSLPEDLVCEDVDPLKCCRFRCLSTLDKAVGIETFRKNTYHENAEKHTDAMWHYFMQHV